MPKSANSLTREQKEAVGLLSIGTFLEYFDLMLYVHMAVLLNELFFPKTDPFTSSLIAAFAFCSTYLLRPVGALIFGYIGDNIGRKATVIMTTSMMATSCIIMANLPTYAQVGITATIIITICRILQGMSSIGEVIGAQLYLTEIIKPPQQYASVAMIPFFVSIGSSASLGIASLVTVHGLNWRIAFWLGACIAIIGAFARVKLRETPEFVDAKKRLNASVDNKDEKINRDFYNAVNKKDKVTKTTFYLFFLDCMWPLCFYMTYVVCANILKNSFGYTAEEVIRQNFIVSIFQISNYFLFFLLLRRNWHPLLILRVRFVVLFCIFCLFPFFLNNAQSGTSILLLQIGIIFFTCDASPAASVFFKYFPIFRRFTYTSFIYAISRAITYIITSFGAAICMEYFGNYGLLIIILPLCILFYLGLNYFSDLEKDQQL